MEEIQQHVYEQLKRAVYSATDAAVTKRAVFMTFTPVEQRNASRHGGYQQTAHVPMTDCLEENLFRVMQKVETGWVPMGVWFSDGEQTMLAATWPFTEDELWDVLQQMFTVMVAQSGLEN